MSGQTIVDRYRQPEYTGENRCIACTIVNTILAIVVGNLVLLGLLALDQSIVVAGSVGLIVVVGASTHIWLRGYLVPGTPTLTRRYFPAWLLAWFGKEPVPNGGATIDSDHQIDVEEALLSAGALQFDDTGEDFELTPTFRRAWREAIEDVDETDLERAIAEVFDVDGELEVVGGSQSIRVHLDAGVLGRWESSAAIVADIGACRVLESRYDGWEDLPTPHRADLAGGLRLFIEICPACGGQTSFDTETATSCCNEYEVATVSCNECGARIFEIPVDSVAGAG